MMTLQGGLTQEEDRMLQDLSAVPSWAFAVFSGFGSFVGWFGLPLAAKLQRLPPSSGFPRFCAATGYAYIVGNFMYNVTFRLSPVMLLKEAEGRMKMELANIILTKHSDDEYLVEAVKKHFFAEHLFGDLHQDQPLFRWHPRCSYTDSVFVERMKEIEATNSYDEARTVSGGTTADNGPSGELMEDPFACILDSPGDVESNNPPGNISTVLKRSELRARRRSRRHHHRRHADDKFAAL
ncbi:uncharacterized protein LOC120650979 isoform X3 [Panicum virgatum]|uniref:uncharacterized protein LOC120650979 isoform X3 n=1 Tax=Panicum virgatum TaxID=38727 RepID=UPI0019D6102E|nr:uncharacterized protein LOC120650979 isoform X3 [Panicum virgatum]